VKLQRGPHHRLHPRLHHHRRPLHHRRHPRRPPPLCVQLQTNRVRLGDQHKLHTPLGCSTRGTTPCDARSRLSLSSAELWTVSYWTVLALVCLLVYVRLLLSTDERSHMGYCEAAESGFGWSSHDTSPWRGDGGALYAVLILHGCSSPCPSARAFSAWVEREQPRFDVFQRLNSGPLRHVGCGSAVCIL